MCPRCDAANSAFVECEADLQTAHHQSRLEWCLCLTWSEGYYTPLPQSLQSCILHCFSLSEVCLLLSQYQVRMHCSVMSWSTHMHCDKQPKYGYKRSMQITSIQICCLCTTTSTLNIRQHEVRVSRSETLIFWELCSLVGTDSSRFCTCLGENVGLL
jgi:hypothetical protein